MFDFLAEHWGTMLAGGILLSAVLLIVIKMIRDRRAGKSSCGCCSGCGNANCSRRTAGKER